MAPAVPPAPAPPPRQPSVPRRPLVPRRPPAPPRSRSRRAPPTRTSVPADVPAAALPFTLSLVAARRVRFRRGRRRGLAEPFVFVLRHGGQRSGGRRGVPHVHRTGADPPVREVSGDRRRGELAGYLFPGGQRRLRRGTRHVLRHRKRGQACLREAGGFPRRLPGRLPPALRPAGRPLRASRRHGDDTRSCAGPRATGIPGPAAAAGARASGGARSRDVQVGGTPRERLTPWIGLRL